MQAAIYNPFGPDLRRTARLEDPKPSAEASAAASQRLARAIERPEYRKEGGNAVRGKQKTEKVLSIMPTYDLADAQKLARKLTGKWPRLFSREKTLEGVERMYLPMLYSQVLLPIRRPSAFRELYILTDAGNRLVTLEKGRFFTHHNVSPDLNIGYSENIVLSALREIGKGDFSRIRAETGMRPEQLKQTLEKLSGARIVIKRNDRYSIIECSRSALKHKLNFDEVSIDEGSICAQFEKKKALHYTKLLFPACEVTPISVVYLPFYRIIMRRGDKLRMLAFDSLFMKDRSESLLR